MSRGIILIWLLVFVQSAFADGGMFKSEQAPTLADPTIPFQRAYLAFDGQKETLIVASTANTEAAADLVWVVPIPSPPTQLAAVRPNVFKPLIEATPPKFNPAPEPWMPAKVVGIGFGLALMFIAAARSARTRFQFIAIVLIGSLLGLACWHFIPNDPERGRFGMAAGEGTKGDSGIDSSPGVEILETKSLGSYDLQVVRGTEGDGLIEWFKANQVHMPDRARTAVREYMDDKWVFLVAKLKTSSEGHHTPHPLKVEFNTSRAVYPMRLTGSMGADVAVELFVLGPGYAACTDMRYLAHGSIYSAKRRDHSRFNVKLASAGNEHGFHADLADSAGDLSILTRLRATANPNSMNHDWYLDFEDGPWIESKAVDTREGANFRSLRIGVAIGLLVLLISGYLRVSGATKINALWLALASLFLTLLTYSISMSVDPGFETAVPSGSLTRYIDFGEQHFENAIDELSSSKISQMQMTGSLTAYLSNRSLIRNLQKPSEAELTDRGFAVLPYRDGSKVIFQDDFGRRYESNLPGIKP